MRTDILQVFRIFMGIDNLKYEDFFELSKTGLRGHKWKIATPSVETRLRKNSFSIRTINTWNALPSEVINSPSINAFKNALEKHWKKLEIKYDPDDPNECYP